MGRVAAVQIEAAAKDHEVILVLDLADAAAVADKRWPGPHSDRFVYCFTHFRNATPRGGTLIEIEFSRPFHSIASDSAPKQFPTLDPA